MGLITDIFATFFGGGRNALKDTVEVFRPNAEASEVRTAAFSHAALAQFATEFAAARRGPFDRFMDALNRLPRPAMALGTMGLFVSAMTDPVWFAARMQGVALVPDPLWWLMGAVVSFYFGARHQTKSQDFQRSVAEIVSRTSAITQNISALEALRADGDASPSGDDTGSDIYGENAALDDWRRSNGR